MKVMMLLLLFFFLTGLMKVEPMQDLPHVDTRLDASDADLVDVIHTDGNFAGTMEPSGHVDFYVGRSHESLGSSQKDCGCTDNCDHARSFKLFADSVRQQVAVDEIMGCEGVYNFTLSGCEAVEGKVLGYFYKGEMKGLVGVLIKSDGVEKPCISEEDVDWEEEEDFDWEGKEDDWETWGSDEDWEDLDYEGDLLVGRAEHFEEKEKSSRSMINQAVAKFNFDSFSLLGSHTVAGTDNNVRDLVTAPPESMAGSRNNSETSCSLVCISIASVVIVFVLILVLICLYACSRTSYLRLHSSKQSL